MGKLGAGSMGTVYRARQEAMGRDVAVKILRADRAFDAMAKARFAREARAMSLLSSPHTVTVFDFGEIPDPHPDDLAPSDASLYLAMELLEGESLGARLKRRGRLPIEEAASIAREALLSLAEAHDKGIIHRDLKPDNLFLARAPQASGGEMVKVLDFGIAKVRVEPNVDALETQAGTVFGTPRYMSPEQAQGKELDARSDLYTLGVLLYQMLVGRAPFVDDDAVVVMARHIKSTAVAPAQAAPDAGIGAALSALVMRVLAKDPADRPATAQVFLAQLDAAVRAGSDDRARADRGGGRDIVGGLAQALGYAGGHSQPAGHPGATGEMAPVVHDGLGVSPVTTRARSRMPRARAGLLVSTSAAVVISAGLFALGALRPARAAPARAEIAHLVAAHRLALLQAESAASAALLGATSTIPASAAPMPAGDASAAASRARGPSDPAIDSDVAPTAPTVTTPHAITPPAFGTQWSAPARKGKNYKKFD
jgi:serine/threonine-protein kinase